MARVGIWAGPAWEDWNEEDYLHGVKKIAGSEAWAYELAACFAKWGHDVTLIASPGAERKITDNFMLIDWREEGSTSGKWDVFIMMRSLSFAIEDVDATKKILLLTDPLPDDIEHSLMEKRLDIYDSIGVLSEFHKWSLMLRCDAFMRAGSKMFRTCNGFSSQFYHMPAASSKKKFQAVWSSRVGRSFFPYYQSVIFPIIERHPDFKLLVTYNLMTPEEQGKLSLLPNVESCRGVNKETLARLQCESMFWFHSGEVETFCISALENCAAGNFIVAPKSFGLASTLSDLDTCMDPVLTWDDKNAQGHIDMFESFLNMDECEAARYRAKVISIASKYSWERSAREVEAKFI